MKTLSRGAFGVFAPVFAMMLAASALGAERLVPSQYPNIAAAAAASNNGDVILVSPGVYNAGFSFAGKQLVVRSTAGSLVTVIDVSGTGGTAITVQSGEPTGTRIEGFSIRAATSSAVVVSGGASLDIANCRITDSVTSAQQGGAGLLVSSGSVNVSGTLFQNLRASGALAAAVTGGAVSVNAGASAVLSDCQFVNCVASQQFAANGSQVGTWSARGGAVWCESSSVSVVRSQFTGCSAVLDRTYEAQCFNVGRNGVCESYGGAVAIGSGGTGNLESCSFATCVSRTGNGVQRWLTQYDASQQWQASHAYGGAVAAIGGGRITMNTNSFSDCSTVANLDTIGCGTGANREGGNSRRSLGGSVYVDGAGSSTSVSSDRDSFLRGNCALSGTAGGGWTWGGSALMVVPNGTQATISNSRITSCSDRALRIGAGTSVAMLTCLLANSQSTGIYVDGNTPILSGCTLKAGAGSPVTVVNSATGPTIVGTTFCANSSNAVSGPWVDGGNNVFSSSCPVPCPGNFNGDIWVDGADLGILLGDWGSTGLRATDMNFDGVVDGTDLGLLLPYLRTNCP